MTFSPHDPSGPQPEEPSFVERHHIHPVVFAVLSLFVVFVLYQLVAGTVTFLLVGSSTVTRENVTEIRLLTMAGQLLCILLPTLVLARLLSRNISTVFGWRIPSVSETLYAVLGLFFLQQMFQIYLFFQDMIPLPDAVRHMVDPFKKMIEEMFRELVQAESLPELVFVILVVAVVPAIVEELLFRGLIQRSFEKSFSGIHAAVLAGTIFGLYHFNPFAVVPLVGLGCYFGFLRYRSRSIILAMTAHFLNNALAAIAVYFQMESEMIIGAKESLDRNVGAVVIQLLLYFSLFLMAFFAYLRSTVPVTGDTDDRV